MDQQTQQSLGPVEFTFDWYRRLLEDLQDRGLEFRTLSEGVTEGAVLLRHDVDLSVEKTLTMARIEAEQGVQATYCFLLTSPLYNPFERKRRDQIRAVAALGHDVALHFSTHEYWEASDRPDDDELVARVDEERALLGTLLSSEPETVSFHVPPSWVLDRSFEGFRNAYGPAYFGDVDYVADFPARWRRGAPARAASPAATQLLTHPGLWGEEDADFETRVEEGVTEACDHAGAKADMEFLSEAYSQ
jgi:hypothetical protein